MPILGIIASSFAASTNSYESIATVTVGGGGSSTITFSSIPSTYKHLQIRYIARATASQDLSNIRLRMGNGSVDTGSNYSWHRLDASGGTPAVTSDGAATQTSIVVAGIGTAANNIASNFGAGVVDVLDFANTSKYKTTRSLSGFDNNSNVSAPGRVNFNSGLWQSTSAVTNLEFAPSSGSFAQYSHFALYGIK